MTPAAITAELNKAGVKNVTAPSCSVAGEKVDSGTEAKCFGDYMRMHALLATGGLNYSQMPRYATADGKGTNDATQATKTPAGGPADNAARDIWVTQTALSNALYTSFFASGVALFAIVVGIALLLVGVGFIVMVAVSRRAAPPRRGRPGRRRLTRPPSNIRASGASRPHDPLRTRPRFRADRASAQGVNYGFGRGLACWEGRRTSRFLP